MATAKTDAQKVSEYRKTAMDKSLPQEVRDQADMKANEIEAKSVDLKAGVKLAKGGVVGKMPMKTAAKMPMKKEAPKKAAGKPMMYGGAVVAKAPPKELPMRGSRTATNMAKGGSVKKAKK